eukprot:GHVU01101958.1.p3 GENE.GHVU01101958.1~~GHVU01101958.1.p3  ORF type:complete len:100 (-),score=11.57 GHVU01101958.1:710-1009(-)
MQPGGSFIIAINIHHRGKTILSTPNFNSQQGSKMNADDIVVVLKMVPRAHVQTVWGRPAVRLFSYSSTNISYCQQGLVDCCVLRVNAKAEENVYACLRA